MKKTFLTLCLASIVLTACEKNANEAKSDAGSSAVSNTTQTSNKSKETPKAAIKFETEIYDFGTVDEGKKVVYAYKFKNEGKNPLVIESAKPSCGCTVPTFPKEPIAPGSTGEIVAEFDSQGRPGEANKTITITANTEPTTTVLTLKGTVKAKNPQTEDLSKIKGPLKNQ